MKGSEELYTIETVQGRQEESPHGESAKSANHMVNPKTL